MDWSIWAIAGLVLLLVEMLTPGGFFFAFLAAAALATAAMARAGWVTSATAQIFVFAVLGVASMMLLRRRLQAWVSQGFAGEMDTLVGETAVAVESIAPGGVGKAELRGTTWTARNAGATPLHAGERCRVERVDGLTLFVRKEGEA